MQEERGGGEEERPTPRNVFTKRATCRGVYFNAVEDGGGDLNLYINLTYTVSSSEGSEFLVRHTPYSTGFPPSTWMDAVAETLRRVTPSTFD